MSKPMTEKETRIHLLEHARVSGYEAPIKDIFRRVDEAVKHARTEEERQMIKIQGLQEIDAYFSGGQANLDNVTLKGIEQETIDKFKKR